MTYDIYIYTYICYIISKRMKVIFRERKLEVFDNILFYY